MTSLTHPTQAEQAVEQFRAQIHPHDGLKRTVSLVTICQSMGAHRQDKRDRHGWCKIIEYTFDDDSSLQISGRGLNHHVETFLP